APIKQNTHLLPSTARHSLFLITLTNCRFRVLNEVHPCPRHHHCRIAVNSKPEWLTATTTTTTDPWPVRA
ncbi:hypothetical protein MUK42_20146, partial [Musa troglodytarum]